MERKLIAKNDLPIYYYSNESLHKFCMTLNIKAGILYEDKEELGITHCFEHMVFRNINRVLDNNMKQCLDKMGAYFNGCTFKEFVEFKIIAAKEHFLECADILSKVLETIDISSKEYCAEMKRIKAEIREEDERKSIDYIGSKVVFKDTGLDKSIAGKNSTLSALTLERVRSYAKEICTADNMFIYVTGAVDDSQIEKLGEKVGAYRLEKSLKTKNNIAPITAQFMNRDQKIKKKKEDYFAIRYSFDIDVTRYTKPELDLLYDILFDGECSKIHDELSEKTGYVYSYSSALEQYNNIASLYFSYEIDEKNLYKSVKKVVRVLNSLKKKLGEELSYVKPNYVDNGEMDLDEPEKLNWIMAYESHILEQNYSCIEERKQAYAQVTNDQINKLAQDIFKKENLVITIKYNKNTSKKKIKKKEIQDIISQLNNK